MSFVKVQHKGQVTIPTRLRTRAGISEGDVVKATFDHGKIIFTPKRVVSRRKSIATEDEYTREQRRIIDREITRGLEEFEKGRYYGPFETVEALEQSLRENSKKLKAGRNRSSR